MAQKPRTQNEPKRLNRAVGAGEALGRILDPALKKRGFASRDLVTHWTTIAPEPYNRLTLPDRLTWPRGAGAEGATLYLRCAPGQALALAHEGQAIAAAINRYFGYVLIGAVRMSLAAFQVPDKTAHEAVAEPSPAARARVAARVEAVADEGVRAALEQLGARLAARRGR